LVDFVTLESYLAGKGAAKYIKNPATFDDAVYVKTTTGNGVGYIVPQRVNIKTDEDVKLYFRVRQVYKNARVILEVDGETVSNKKKIKLAPGEMEDVTIPKEIIEKMTDKSEISVRVEA
jgi:hypothetical protein